MGNLEFNANLPPSASKPLGKVLNVLDKHLPGFFNTADTPQGVQTASIHFVEGTFAGIDSEEFFYMHARSTGNAPTIDDTDRLSIVSGICLFGEWGLKTYGPSGESTVLDRPGVSASIIQPPVIEVQRGETQLYVPESIARLGRTMIALVQFAQKRDKATELFVHVPGPEYKIQAEVAHASGKVTLPALQKYYNLVDAEVSDIQAQFSELFELFGLQTPVFGSPLDEFMIDVEPGSLMPSHFKNTPFEPAVSDTASMKTVEHVSEVAAYVQSAQNGSLALFVDNHAQEKIFKAAKQVAGFKGVALYPLPLCASTQTKNLLYHQGATKAEIAQAVAPWGVTFKGD